MDFNIRLSRGNVLKGIVSSPGEKTRAIIIMVHGLGEHINRYSDWAGLFREKGFAFLGVDMPGHGSSPGKRGYIRSYSVTDEMIDTLIHTSKMTFPGCPVFLYGHSLGGGIVLDYLVRKKPGIKGAIVTSPWLKLSFEPAKSKIMLASLVKNVLPGLTQPSGLNVNHISHENAVVEKYTNDPLVHGKIAVSLFYSAMQAGKNALQNAAELTIPVLLMHGSDDMITSPEGSREFAEKSNKVELKIWQGGYHELHNEKFRGEVFDYILKWITK